MAIAIGLIILLAFTVIFHFVSPWWFTPLASNWGAMDDTIVLTFWVTGLVFIAISLFLIYCVIRYRHADGVKAAYEPEHKALEMWLMVFTTIGVIILLAPGLKVWGDYIEVPEDAHEIEVIAQQWQWSYRYPGADGKLGSAHNKHVSFDNPVGINPDDPHGQDDVVIVGSELHLPLDKPVKVLLRSKDVLHNFYIPQFRAKMDIVPGLVSYLWFTPTKIGKYEVACAELCGVGHYNMRSQVIVDTAIEYNVWLASQKTFGESFSTAKQAADPLVERGREVAQNNGCLGCHSLDGGAMLGPTWKGMYGKEEILADGSTQIVDDDYIIESVVNPNAKIVKGYPAVMPPAQLSDEDMQALLAFARSSAATTEPADNSDTGQKTTGVDAVIPVHVEDSLTLVDKGRELTHQRACIACHSLDGKKGVGPSWLGVYGSNRVLEDGSTVIADEEYLMNAINQPNLEIVKGFAPVMPPSRLSDEETQAIIEFMKSGI